ncbi:MAG: hypothetical protein WCO78_05015, partial [Candidatus Roizmanbacteria bacterium]
ADLSATAGITNGQLANSTIALSLGATGTDITISGSPASLGGTLTLNIPDAGASSRGVITTGAQTIAGAKSFTGISTFTSAVNIGSTGQFQVNSLGAITSATGINSSGSINLSGLTASKGIFTDASKNLTSTGILGADQGGTGIANNAASTLSIVGNFGTTFNLSGTTSLSLPTSGTLISSVTAANGVSALNTAGALAFTLGAITPTTVNGLTITPNGTNALNIAAGKTLSVSKSLTLTGTDNTTMTFPTTSAILARTDAGQTYSGNQIFDMGGSTSGSAISVTNANDYSGTGILSITANTATTGQIMSLSATSLTSGNVLKITGGSAMTTGSDLDVNGGNFVHSANGETGSLASFAFSDTTSGAFTSTSNGILVSPTVNITAGAATKTINGLSVAPNLTACTTATCTVTGLNVDNVTDSGNFNTTGLKIGTGWDEAIRANGLVTIGAQSDTPTTGASTFTMVNSAAGTFVPSTDINIDKIASSVVYKGHLFVSTAETDLAAVYRYDGGTTWVRVTSTTLGKAISADTAVADAFALAVFDGKLWIGSQTGASNLAAIYYSTNADTAIAGDNFTMVNSARGTINGVAQAGIQDMVVYNGQLIVATQKTDTAEIDRYDGGTTFTRINATIGKSAAETTADKDAFNLNVCANTLYSGSISGSTTGIVASYQGNGTTWINTTTVATGGNFGAETVTSNIDSMACWNGNLYISTSKTAGNSASIYYYRATSAPISAVPANWTRINVTPGKMQNADTALIDSFILETYNGRLYAGSQTAAGEDAGALFEYGGIPLADWTLMTTGARGVFGAKTGVNAISTLQEFNRTLYVGTDDGTNNIGALYTWNKSAENSYALQFDSGSSNYGAISFVGNRQANDNAGLYGSFLFSNSIQLSSGSFDYAEDFPTLDSSLSPGDLVSVDPNYAEHVKRAGKGDIVVGVVSTDPGLRLSSKAIPATGATWVPIALVGRVPVKVTTSNGPIHIGDSIALSSISGVGMKATQAGDVIGQALSEFTADGQGTVIVFIKNAYFTGAHLGDGSTTIATDSASLASDSAGLTNIQTKLGANDRIASLEAKTSNITLDADGSTIFSTISSAIAKIYFKIETVFESAVTFVESVTFKGRVTYEDKDAAGYAVIKTGADHVDVLFAKAYSVKPIVVASAQDPSATYFVKSVSETGFTIQLYDDAIIDTTYSWIAQAAPNAMTTYSSDVTSPTPTAVSTISPAISITPTIPSAQVTEMATPTVTPTVQPTESVTPIPSDILSPTPSNVSLTETVTPSPTKSITPTQSITPTP